MSGRPKNKAPIFQQRTPDNKSDNTPAIVQRIRKMKEGHPMLSRDAIAQKVGAPVKDVTAALTTPTYLKNIAKRKLRLGARSLRAAEQATKVVSQGLATIKPKDLEPSDIRDLAWTAGAMSKQATELIGSAALDAELENDAALGALFLKKMKEKYGALHPSDVPESERLNPVDAVASVVDPGLPEDFAAPAEEADDRAPG
jgi:hypothetical protein